LPIQHVARWARFVTALQGSDRRKLADRLAHRFELLPRLRTSPPVSATATAIVSAWTSISCGSAPLDFTYSQRNPRATAKRSVAPF
jgi:hypothetical protein